MYVRMFMCIFMQYMYDEACFFLHFGCYRAENSAIFSERSSSLCQAATHNLENKMAARQRPGWRVQKMIHYIVGRVTMNPKQGYFAEMLSIKLHALNEQHRFTLIVFCFLNFSEIQWFERNIYGDILFYIRTKPWLKIEHCFEFG